MCVIWVLRFEPRFPHWCVCGPGCLARTCSASCFYKHKAQWCRVAPGAHPRAGLLELSLESGIAEAILSTGVQVVPLKLDEVVTPPLVVIVNNCSSLSSSACKAKYGPWPDKHRVDGRIALTQVLKMFSVLSRLVQGGKSFIFLHPHCSILWSALPVSNSSKQFQ